MKRTYEEPKMCWQPIRSNRAVADVCWAYVNKGTPFYYNTKGTGYAELRAVGQCKSGKTDFEISFHPDTMSQEDRAAAQLEIDSVIVQVKAQLGNSNPSPYKGSVFSPSIDPTWS